MFDNASHGTPTFIAIGQWQISAGTDYWGNSTVDMEDSYGVMQYNAGSNRFTTISQVPVQFAAGEGGYDYYVEPNGNLHEHADLWGFYWEQSTHRVRYGELVTDNVIEYGIL
jgi:hypothetical protein